MFFRFALSKKRHLVKCPISVERPTTGEKHPCVIETAAHNQLQQSCNKSNTSRLRLSCCTMLHVPYLDVKWWFDSKCKILHFTVKFYTFVKCKMIRSFYSKITNPVHEARLPCLTRRSCAPSDVMTRNVFRPPAWLTGPFHAIFFAMPCIERV